MKNKLFFALICIVGLPFAISQMTLRFSKNRISEELILIQDKQVPFNLAITQIQSLLDEGSNAQLAALNAILSNPILVEGTSLLPSIVKIAIARHDYSDLDAISLEIEKNPSIDSRQTKKVEKLILTHMVQETALLIAVANGSNDAFHALDAFRQSASDAERRLVQKSERWLELHGTRDTPKAGPFQLFGETYSEQKYMALIDTALSSTIRDKQSEALRSLIWNLNVQNKDEKSNLLLLSKVAEFYAKNKNTTDGQMERMLKESIMGALFARGPNARAFFVEASEDENIAVASTAQGALELFDEMHNKAAPKDLKR